MSEPLFSVIVPTYDRPELLAQAIDSILAQTVEDFECIVVDDAGPHPARVPDDPRVRVVRRERNGGDPASRNTGLDNARGRYVVFLDDDDLYTPDRLAIGLEGVSRAKIAVCFRRGTDGSRTEDRRLEGDVHGSILDGPTPQMGQVTAAREVIPRFDERFAGSADIEWWVRASKASTVATVPRDGLIYRLHSGPRNTNGAIARIRCQRMLFDMYPEYFAAHRRAAAFRWKRIGIMSASIGASGDARRALARSFRLRPDLRTAVHLMRSFRPAGGAGSKPAPDESA